MWSSTVGLVNGKHRYLTAETFGFKINSNGQVLKKRQQWTIEPFPENVGPDGSVSSAASVSSQCAGQPGLQQSSPPTSQSELNDSCILTFNSCINSSSLTSIKSSSNGSNASDQDAYCEEHENVAIKSHLNKYLAVDSFGNVTCDSSEKTENARFTITICSMSQGRSKDEHIFWAFKNVERDYYLGTTEDGMICCNAKVPKSRAELWHLHLIPSRGASFFGLKSFGRKRYARVFIDEALSIQSIRNGSQELVSKAQVQLDATITWGPETLFQLKYYEGGRYSLLTDGCMYLSNEGKCIVWSSNDESALPPQECLFTLEYHSGFLAFRDSFSHYLAAAGRSSVLKSRSIGVSRDELFVFEPAPIQVSLKATFNNRWVSIKQGVDLSANQTENSSNTEVFQLTYHRQTQNWSIMTHDCNFWTVSPSTNTVSVCKPGDYEGMSRGQFRIVWSETDASCTLKYIDANQQERWLAARKSGQLYLASGAQLPAQFIIRFQNRRLLNLRPVDGSGFVGLKTNSKQLEATKTSYDSIAIEYSNQPITNNSVSFSTENTDNCRPEVQNSLKSTDVQKLSEPNSMNIFNVKLNSTKMGQSVLSRSKGSNKVEIESANHDKTTTISEVSIGENVKELESSIDDNNNNYTGYEDELEKKENGSVESASAPSVASIISSFSRAKVSSTNNSAQAPTNAQGSTNSQINSTRSSSTVMRLASSFGSGQVSKDSLSSVATYETAMSTTAGAGLINNEELDSSKSYSDQLAQLECCYLKTISNNRYLVVADDSSVICDATNKACAQPWILELRSHNSIAIRASDNHAYLQLGTNGTILVSRCDPKEASLWEF